MVMAQSLYNEFIYWETTEEQDEFISLRNRQYEYNYTYTSTIAMYIHTEKLVEYKTSSCVWEISSMSTIAEKLSLAHRIEDKELCMISYNIITAAGAVH